jgi:hypothetical protein
LRIGAGPESIVESPTFLSKKPPFTPLPLRFKISGFDLVQATDNRSGIVKIEKIFGLIVHIEVVFLKAITKVSGPASELFSFVKFQLFRETIFPELRLYRYWWIERCRSLHPPTGSGAVGVRFPLSFLIGFL